MFLHLIKQTQCALFVYGVLYTCIEICVCVCYAECMYLEVLFMRTPQVEHSGHLHFVFLHHHHYIQWSPSGETWCSSSSLLTQSFSFQAHLQHHHRPRRGRTPSPGWYPFGTACTCCSGVLGAAAWSVIPTHRSWTPWWMDTNEMLAWSQLETWWHIQREREDWQTQDFKTALIILLHQVAAWFLHVLQHMLYLVQAFGSAAEKYLNYSNERVKWCATTVFIQYSIVLNSTTTVLEILDVMFFLKALKALKAVWIHTSTTLREIIKSIFLTEWYRSRNSLKKESFSAEAFSRNSIYKISIII